jgi:hypothetical protein
MGAGLAFPTPDQNARSDPDDSETGIIGDRPRFLLKKRGKSSIVAKN